MNRAYDLVFEIHEKNYKPHAFSANRIDDRDLIRTYLRQFVEKSRFRQRDRNRQLEVRDFHVYTLLKVEFDSK